MHAAAFPSGGAHPNGSPSRGLAGARVRPNHLRRFALFTRASACGAMSPTSVRRPPVQPISSKLLKVFSNAIKSVRHESDFF